MYRIGNTDLVDSMTLSQLKDYWNELKISRYDSFFYMNLLDKIKKLNPNLVFPAEEEIDKIKSQALSIALWEENWELNNKKRVEKGNMDYSIFYRDKNSNIVRNIGENIKSKIATGN